jgi:Polyketide cyclase / dehydrase and lipid transport
MPHIQATAQIPVDPVTLWRTAGSFHSVGRWHPMVVHVEGQGNEPGALRIAQTRDGQQQVEQLQEVDPGQRLYRYAMISTPMPVTDYVGEFRATTMVTAPARPSGPAIFGLLLETRPKPPAWSASFSPPAWKT